MRLSILNSIKVSNNKDEGYKNEQRGTGVKGKVNEMLQIKFYSYHVSVQNITYTHVLVVLQM